jgi:hypoxanthine phosphoribosyltransferase
MNPTGVIALHDKSFVLFISHERIQEAIRKVASQINEVYAGQSPLFIGVLNGSFMFAAGLMQEIQVDAEITFIRLSSYSGTQTTGKVREVMGLKESVAGRPLVIVEDIVDTGHTLDFLIDYLRNLQPASVAVATMLYKPKAYQGKYPVDFPGMEIGNEFVVGYGLDYEGKGRQLREIYILKE